MAMFRFIPVIGITGYARFFAVALENLVIIANGMSSPVMLLIFNVDVRKYALNVFRNNAISTVLVVM
uniref:Gate domain-containing protein n=1 Tax=Angiostrongylus cantonensis TaxID=6313 RepID=A0A0K0D5F1_ANGCA